MFLRTHYQIQSRGGADSQKEAQAHLLRSCSYCWHWKCPRMGVLKPCWLQRSPGGCRPCVHITHTSLLDTLRCCVQPVPEACFVLVRAMLLRKYVSPPYPCLQDELGQLYQYSEKLEKILTKVGLCHNAQSAIIGAGHLV